MDKEKEEEVKRWLNNLKLEQYTQIFFDEGYEDMDTIINGITENDLLEMGINKRGHRKKIIISIQRLKHKENDNNDDQIAKMEKVEGNTATVYIG